jgi:hypothetical protein
VERRIHCTLGLADANTRDPFARQQCVCLLGQEEAPPNPTCQIKGNVNRNGERIFHVPGQHDYGRVNMNSPAKRWFCSKKQSPPGGEKLSAKKSG